MPEELINVVILKEDGEIKELLIDMDEKKNELGLYMQDKLSFIGQINREDTENMKDKKTNIILIKGLNSEKKGKKINKLMIF